jgi:hypothetical protein
MPEPTPPEEGRTVPEEAPDEGSAMRAEPVSERNGLLAAAGEVDEFPREAALTADWPVKYSLLWPRGVPMGTWGRVGGPDIFAAEVSQRLTWPVGKRVASSL